MNSFSPTEEELLSRLNWFVKLRWLFLLGMAGALFFAIKAFDLKLELTPIAIIGGIVLVYNFLFYILHRFFRSDPEFETTALNLRIEANLQIGLDLLSLIALVHYTGGIENPFVFFFVFHMILGSILLAGRDIWFQAFLSVSLLFALLGLSYFDVVKHYHISGFASDDLWTNAPYIWAGVLSFSTTIFMAVYMTNSIARSVRSRERELFVAKNQLEKLNRELIRQQNLLIQSEKLASLGKLSAGIAHELNNPLTGVLSFSHFIKSACADNPQVQSDIDVVIRETERCKKIIRGLLNYARQSRPEKKRDDIIQFLNETISLVENHKDFKNIKIIRDYPENMPLFLFDKYQIQQVFMNLIVNAQEAMTQGDTLYIRAELDEDEESMEITFKDTGYGISEENLRNIFDPFFTTKEGGTGLGLSITLGIVENHGGKLVATSKIGEGSTFTIKLPIN